jgi:hypothetical protein
VTLEPPSDDVLLAAAGSVRHSRLLVKGVLDGLAVAVVDANGDGALQEVVVMTWQDGAWQESAAGGAGVLADGWTNGVAFAYGRTLDVEAVDVVLRGDIRRVPVTGDGWWLVLARAEEDERFDLTGVPDPFPTTRTPGPHRPPRVAG